LLGPGIPQCRQSRNATDCAGLPRSHPLERKSRALLPIPPPGSCPPLSGFNLQTGVTDKTRGTSHLIRCVAQARMPSEGSRVSGVGVLLIS
jgi:hypothetical protein